MENGCLEIPELCDRFESLYTGAVADTLDELGHRDQTLKPDITPLSTDVSMAGIAFPIVGRPNQSVDPEENIRSILEMLSDTPKHSVFLYDTNDRSSAHIGELTTTSLQASSCRGAVIDGGARDVSFIREQGFPVFRRYDTPADCVYRWEIIEWDVPAIVGGVEVHPGDIVFGDDDGVLVIPRSIADEVLDRAETRVRSEDEVREAVRAGVDPLKAYEEYGAF